MPNREVLNDLDLMDKIDEIPDRKLIEYTARKMAEVCRDVAGNKKRSWQNRVAILILLAILVTCGIIDPEMLKIVSLPIVGILVFLV